MKKVILAYSGGLDTSVILKWLQEEKNLEVITYTADMGQGDIPDNLEERAKTFGASKAIIDDLSEEFVKDYVFPMFRCNAVFEGEYLLGTAIARPLIAKKIVETAKCLLKYIDLVSFKSKTFSKTTKKSSKITP